MANKTATRKLPERQHEFLHELYHFLSKGKKVQQTDFTKWEYAEGTKTVSRPTVQKIFNALKRRGMIEWEPYRFDATVKITDAGQEYINSIGE